MIGAPPAIRIDVRVDDGRACGVAIDCSGALQPSRLFRGRAAHEIPAMAQRIFALCPMAQSEAARLAVAEASGERADALRSRALQLLAERCAENLRSAVMGWPDAAPDGETLGALRGALDALRGILAAPDDPSCVLRVRAVENAARALGLPDKPDAALTRWFGTLWREAQGDEEIAAALAPQPVSSGADDDAMFDALDSGRAAIPAAPTDAISFLDHFRARWTELAHTIDILARIARGEAVAPANDGRRSAMRTACVALDSPRGRLFHRIVLDHENRVADYRIVTPTDRNFAPDGPFAIALQNLRVGAGREAELRVARLAALYDPCVAIGVAVRECADA
jgi:uptake hydrogenase large subunit